MSKLSNKNPARQVVDFANQSLNIKTAAIILAGSTLVSSLLGIIRDRLLNGYYLDVYPASIDAYTVAFIIPDFMFTILISGALSVTMIPVFNQLRNDKRTNSDQSAWDLASSMINFMSLVTLVLSILIIVFADFLVNHVVGPDLPEDSRALAASMMRVIAINPFLFSISGVLSGIQQAVGRYFFYALAPAVYNIGIIFGTVFFTGGITVFGKTIFEGGIMGVALGVLLGAVLQLIIASVGILGLGFNYKLKIDFKNRGFRKVLKLFPARSLDQGADYINNIVETRLASGMLPGTIRSYNQALSLHMMPVNLIGVAISNAAFASMTEKLSLGQSGQFKKQVQMILRTIIWISLPISTIAYFTRGYLVSFIKNSGDNNLISSLLGALILSIFFTSVYHILARTFYAEQDTKTPFVVSVFSIALNIVLAITFTRVLRMGAYGLAWAQSYTAVVQVLILTAILSKKLKGIFDKEFFRSIGLMAIAGVVAGFAAYGLLQMMPLLSSDQRIFATFPKFCLISGLSMMVYLFLSRAFSLSESDVIFEKAKKILFGSKITKRLEDDEA